MRRRPRSGAKSGEVGGRRSEERWLSRQQKRTLSRHTNGKAFCFIFVKIIQSYD